MTNGSARSALGLTLLLAAGCSLGGPGQQGDLGKDTFQYACVTETDGICDDEPGLFHQEPVYGLPVIALGAKFGLSTNGTTTEARSVNDFIEETSGVSPSGARPLVAKKEGWAAIASFTYDGQPVDLVHVRIVDPSAAKIFTRGRFASTEWSDTTSHVVVTPTSEIQLRVVPTDASDELLAGGLDVTWSVTPAGIIDFTPDTGNNVTNVDVLEDGDVTVTAKVGALTTTVQLSVTGNQTVTSSSSSSGDGGAGGTGGSTATGTGGQGGGQ